MEKSETERIFFTKFAARFSLSSFPIRRPMVGPIIIKHKSALYLQMIDRKLFLLVKST